MLFALILSTFASASEVKPALTCVTSPPSTSFVVWTEKDKVISRVIFHYGAKWAPSIAGIFTGQDLPILERYASTAKRLQDVTDISWPLKSCRQSSPLRFECFGTEDRPSGSQGEVVIPRALYTSTAREDTIAGVWDTVTLNLSFDIKESASQIQMKYYGNDCFETTQMPANGDQLLSLVEARKQKRN